MAIEAYKRDVDRTLIREQLRRSPDESVRKMIAALRFAEALHEAGRCPSRRKRKGRSGPSCRVSAARFAKAWSKSGLCNPGHLARLASDTVPSIA